MRVYVEQTPQKDIMKFVCDDILTAGSYEFTPDDNLSKSPMTQQLFQFPFVKKVFITANFVALQKNDGVEWEVVAQPLKEIINEHLEHKTIICEEKKRQPYTLYAEMTPNPNVMKFVANQILTPITIEVKSMSQAAKVPVAVALFNQYPFVKEVFIQENYLSVTASEKVDWTIEALEIRQFLLEYIQNGNILVEEDFVPPRTQWEEVLENKTYTPTEKQIQKILEEYIKPAVANDGGNIALIEFDEESKTAKMLLQGACSGCPSSSFTLKNGIEAMLKEMMPNVVEHVEAMNG